jgi:di/tricarboxylate transporter
MQTNTTRPRPTGKQLRTRQRAAHLVTGVIVLVAVYAGPLLGPVFTAVVQWVVFPVLVLTGIAMWKGPRIRRMLRGRAAAAAQ